VLSNVDHLFAFAMSGEDARMLHELDGIEEDDITNLDDFTCYAKMSLQGRRLPVFSLILDPPATSDPELAQRIRMRSQQLYARPGEVVDAMITQSLHRSAPPRSFYPLSTRAVVRGNKPTEDAEEIGHNGVSLLHDEKPLSTSMSKPGRGKHRGSGKGTSREMQEQHLSLPLVYEQGEAEDLEE
jgi:hypothetical protein